MADPCKFLKTLHAKFDAEIVCVLEEFAIDNFYFESYFSKRSDADSAAIAYLHNVHNMYLILRVIHQRNEMRMFQTVT